MLQRDYFIRLVQEFGTALQKWLAKDRENRSEDTLKELYNQYIGPYEFYHTAAIEDVIQAMETYNVHERINRIEMLADLYYAEASIQDAAMHIYYLEKAYSLFSYVNERSDEYSLIRMQKIKEIQSKLSM